MSWFRRRPVDPSVRPESEEDRIARRLLAQRDAEGEALDSFDLPAASTAGSASPADAPTSPCSSHAGGAGSIPSDASPGSRTDAAPEPWAPCFPDGSHASGRGGLDLYGPDHVVTCGCGRVAPCRHCP